MGLWSWLAGSEHRSTSDVALLNQCTAMFESLGVDDARSKAIDFVNKAKEEVVRRQSAGEWTHTAESILRSNDPTMDFFLKGRRLDGVTDAEIEWWWSLTPLERVMIEKTDEFNRMSLFITLLKKGVTPDEASRRVFKFHPKFGDPMMGEGDDRPLPIELKVRTVKYIERGHVMPEVMKYKYENSTSFNALIREEIRSGRL